MGLTPFSLSFPLSSIIPTLWSSAFAAYSNFMAFSTALTATKYFASGTSLIKLNNVNDAYDLSYAQPGSSCDPTEIHSSLILFAVTTSLWSFDPSDMGA